mmetsp:Transcript_30215/g.70523  ORF Transcript_30215/g.70523 Transcript_30215/m.70523 type:complete len:235 (+) Transcript_30215:43-747(+)
MGRSHIRPTQGVNPPLVSPSFGFTSQQGQRQCPQQSTESPPGVDQLELFSDEPIDAGYRSEDLGGDDGAANVVHEKVEGDSKGEVEARLSLLARLVEAVGVDGDDGGNDAAGGNKDGSKVLGEGGGSDDAEEESSESVHANNVLPGPILGDLRNHVLQEGARERTDGTADAGLDDDIGRGEAAAAESRNRLHVRHPNRREVRSRRPGGAGGRSRGQGGRAGEGDEDETKDAHCR